MSYEFAELERRLANILRYGVVYAVDLDGALVQVDVGGIVTDWLPWRTPRAGRTRVWHPPEVGEQVMVLSPSGDLGQGMVLAGVYSDEFPAPSTDPDVHLADYLDGDLVIEYHRVERVLRITFANAPGTVRVTNGDVIADGVSLKRHVHGGVVRGGDTTDQPVASA